VRVAQGWQRAGGPLRQHHADGLPPACHHETPCVFPARQA
jgi:hypothetical protein